MIYLIPIASRSKTKHYEGQKMTTDLYDLANGDQMFDVCLSYFITTAHKLSHF